MGEFRRIGHLLHQSVWVFLRPYWGLQVLLMVAVAMTVLFETCFPLTIKFLIDDALIPHDQQKLGFALLILVLLFAVAAAARFAMVVIRSYLHKEVYWDMSTGLFGLLGRLPLSHLDHLPTGHFSPLFDTETLTLAQMVRDLAAQGFYATLQLAVVLATMFVLNWQLALAITLLLPLLLWKPQRRLGPTVDAVDRIRNVVERINAIVQENVSAQPLLRAFGLAQRASHRFNEQIAGRKGARGRLRSVADLRRTLASPHFVMQSFKLSMDNHQAAITLIVIAIGGALSFAGLLTLGTFSAFILLLPLVMGAITRLAEFVQDLGRATLSLERLEAVDAAAQPEPDISTLTRPGKPQQAICFEQVDFSYSDGTPSLRQVELNVPIGQSVAFVGRSGAGKSTLLKLLMGFYSPSSGRVLIDGNDIRSLDPAALGGCFGPVLQQSLLFNSTVRENICFANPAASDAEVVRAATLAGIHDFIVSLPKAYQSPVGDGGKWFSEGQRQRIALARAILPDPAILLLDEVTSSLDPESEATIIATIQRLAQGRTVMMVSHRLASTAFVDRIVLMDQGQIKEQGSHQELLELRGIYHQLWNLQTGFVVSGDGQYAEVSGERLRAIPLFRDVDVLTLDKLAGRFVSQAFVAGQTIYAEADAGDKFYLLVRGTISISTTGAGGQAIRLADLQDGDYFGEVEMVNKGRRTTTVTARTPSLVLALYAEHFETMATELGSLGRVVTQMALGRSLSTICSVGRRRRSHPVWKELAATVPLAAAVTGCATAALKP